MKTKLSAYLSVAPGRRCKTCNNKELSVFTAQWLQMKESGQTDKSFQAFYDRFVRPNYPTGPSFTPFRNHVLHCLGRDPTTGKKLSS